MTHDKPYELLEHTADAKFRSFGKTLEEAFSNAVAGMTAIAADPSQLGDTRVAKISVRGKTLDALLFNMLDEILFLHDTEHILPKCAESLKITKHADEYVLDAVLRGDDSKKWPCNLKAVTYSEMIVKQQKDSSWMIQAVIDI